MKLCVVMIAAVLCHMTRSDESVSTTSLRSRHLVPDEARPRSRRSTPPRHDGDDHKHHHHDGAASHVIEEATLTEADEKFIVDEHNRRRAAVRPRPANMLRLAYDRQLADLAQAYSRRCKFEHNPAPKTANFEWPGENLYVSNAVQGNLTKALARAIELWWVEKSWYDWTTMRTSSPKHVVGHYTEMVWATNHAVGCGVSTCTDVHYKHKKHERAQLVVCYYGPGGNYRGEHPYEAGEPCSRCPPKKKCVC